MKSLILILLIFLLLKESQSFSTNINKNQSEHNNSYTFQNEVSKQFYNLLKNIKIESNSTPISSLKQFINKYPLFYKNYHKLLEIYFTKNQSEEAKTYFQKLASIRKHRQNAHWMLAKLYNVEGRFNLAFNEYSKSIMDDDPSPELIEDIAKFICLHSKKENFINLLNNFRLNDKKLLFDAYFNFYKKNYLKAIKLFTSAQNNLKHNCSVILLKGYSYYSLGEYEKADSIYNYGLRISKLKTDLQSEIKFLTNLGAAAKYIHNHDLAKDYLDQAHSIADSIDDKYRLQIIYGNFGTLNQKIGNYNKAIKNFNQAIIISKNIYEYESLIRLYIFKGQLYKKLGNYNQAINSYDLASKYAKKTKNLEQLININISLGNIYLYLNQISLAKNTFMESFNLSKKNKLVSLQNLSQVKLAEIMILEGKYLKARRTFRDILSKITSKRRIIEQAYWISRVADIYTLEKKYELAKREYLNAFELAKQAQSKSYMAWYRLEIADLEVISGNYNLAIKNYDYVYKYTKEEYDNNMLWQLFLGYGNVFKKSGNLNKAIKAYRKAINYIESIRENLKVEQFRIGYFSDGYETYQNLVSCYLELFENSRNNIFIDSIFYFQEMSKGRALSDLKLQTKSHLHNQEYINAKNNLHMLQREIRQKTINNKLRINKNELLSKLESAKISLLAQRLRIIDKKEYDKSKIPNEIISSEQLCKDLKKKNLGLLFYNLSQEGSFVIAATNNKIDILRIKAKPSDLDSLISELLVPFHNINEKSIAKVKYNADIAHLLYQKLIQPVEKKMNLPNRLLIIPDTPIMNLPFEMLLSKKQTKINYSPKDFPDYKNDFLLNYYSFVYSPNATLIHNFVTIEKESNKILVIANPTTIINKSQDKYIKNNLRNAWSFDSLPYSEIEAREIKKVIPNTMIYKRENATKKKIFKEVRNHNILHFATHAFVDTLYGVFSGLVLTAGEDSVDDGLLMGYEISDFNFKNDLVILSACETGRGKAVLGEGILGLPRSFLSSGVKTVIMTLWKVDDKFCSILLPNFYDNYLNKGLPKADALTKTKILLMNHIINENGLYYQHPIYWASFVFYGDVGSIPKRLNWFSNPFLYLVFFIFILAIFIYYRFNSYFSKKK